jgi:hypothetical protein
MSGKEQQYELLWRNKFLTTEAKSLAEAVTMLEQGASTFKELKELVDSGKVEVEMFGKDDDYIFFYTYDKAIADKYNFSEYEEDDRDIEEFI